MAVFRVECNKGYTIMSNHHLRNKELEGTAKGRLRGADYVIYEQPHTEPTPDLPTLEKLHSRVWTRAAK